MVISAPDIRAWAPPCPLLLKSKLAPAEFAPDPNVPLSSHRTVLRAGFPTTSRPDHRQVLQENYSRQCTVAVTRMVEFLAAGAQMIVAMASQITAAAALTAKVLVSTSPGGLNFQAHSECFRGGWPPSVVYSSIKGSGSKPARRHLRISSYLSAIISILSKVSSCTSIRTRSICSNLCNAASSLTRISVCTRPRIIASFN